MRTAERMITRGDKAEPRMRDGRTTPGRPAGLFNPPRWLCAAPLSLRRLLCAAYALLVAIMSLAPCRSTGLFPALFPGADKLLHALSYAVLTLLLLWAAPLPGRQEPFRLALAAALGFAYGALIEWAQGIFTLERVPSMGDMAANAIGAGLAAAAWKLNSRAGKGSRAS